MIRATCLGHAALLIETEYSRVLMDPILGAAVSGGGNIIDPPRELNVAALDELDLVIISHHHSDHYNIDDLAMIPDAVRHHFIIPNDETMEAALVRWGAHRVTRLISGQTIKAGDLRLTATPSEVPFSEMGILFQQGNLRLLNLVDTVFHQHLHYLAELCGGSLDAVLAPFQAGGYMSFLPLREGGFPPGLVPAIKSWGAEYLEELVSDVAQLHPRLAIAFADGLAYEDAGINARHFPLPDSVFVERLATKGIAGCSAHPGLVVEINEGSEPKTSQAAKTLVRVFPERAAQRQFDPTVQLSDRPLSWHELHLGGRESPSPENWLPILCERMSERLESLHAQPNAESMRLTLEAWHLELLDPASPSIIFCDWPKLGLPSVHVGKLRPASRPYGIVCHGADLARVALGELNLETITLGGLFRYRSPKDDRELEGLRGRTLRPLDWLFGS